jgi:hypothetical protein
LVGCTSILHHLVLEFKIVCFSNWFQCGNYRNNSN